ncbi:hypothetical protein V2J09_002786 [Rumex salicifolius]
MHNPYKIRI